MSPILRCPWYPRRGAGTALCKRGQLRCYQALPCFTARSPHGAEELCDPVGRHQASAWSCSRDSQVTRSQVVSALCPPGPLTFRLTQLSLELRCSFEWALDSVQSQDVTAFCAAQARDTAPVLICALSLSLSAPSSFSSGL